MNPSADFPLFDFSRPVRLVARRAEGVCQVPIHTALPRGQSRFEEDRGGVLLVVERCDWLFPADALPAAVEPQPADTIHDADVVWSIVAVDRRVGGALWKCACRRQE